jgi:hypothetical protein
MTKHEIKLSRLRGRMRALNGLGLNRRGQPLQLRKWRILDRLGLKGKAREKKRRALVRAEWKRDGLTTRGTVRQRRQWPELRGRSQRERCTVWHRDWLERRRYGRGLTSRGTVPRAKVLSPLELAYRELRAETEMTS